MGVKPQTRHVHWKHCWRVIPTRYPSEKLLDRVVDPSDMALVEELDALTSTRLRLERGELNYLQPGEKATGPGGRYIMASFSYSLFNKSRFSDGSFGVFYGAKDLQTAVAETVFHRQEFMRATSESPMMLSMRALDTCLSGKLDDIRHLRHKRSNLYSLNSYIHSQAFGRDLWEKGSGGILYESVRHPKGECVAVFKPSLLSHCHDERALVYEWDGKRILKVYQLREFLKLI